MSGQFRNPCFVKGFDQDPGAYFAFVNEDRGFLRGTALENFKDWRILAERDFILTKLTSCLR